MNAQEAQALIFRAIDSLADQLETDSEALTKFLKVMATFHRYSVYNQIMILLQRPDAIKVAGFQTWKKLGRYVRLGEKGISILAPVLEKKRTDQGYEENVLGFTIARVFDVAQTDGYPLPSLPSVKGDPGHALVKLHRFAREKKIEVIKSEAVRTADGISYGGKIVLRPDMAAAKEFGVLAHELAHELIHLVDDRLNLPKPVLELEAESVAFVVCQAIGLDTNTAFGDYIRFWEGNPKLLRASFERIQKCSSNILDYVL
jgi:hypothetical protein